MRGFIINKFRGDLEILRPGLEFLERETGRPVLGVVPMYRDIRIPEEDAVPVGKIGGGSADGRIRIDVVLHPRMSNFTDFDALEAEPDVSLRYLERPDDRIPDALILPGTKSTIADLRRLKEAGFASSVSRCLERGATVAGICGGFQMLGRQILDPLHVESASDAEPGLGLLPSVTVFAEEKITAQVSGVHLASGTEVRGYEIHMGRSEPSPAAPLLRDHRAGRAVGPRVRRRPDRGRARVGHLSPRRLRQCRLPAPLRGLAPRGPRLAPPPGRLARRSRRRDRQARGPRPGESRYGAHSPDLADVIG